MKNKNIPYIVTQEELDATKRWFDEIANNKKELYYDMNRKFVEKFCIKTFLKSERDPHKRIILEKVLETEDEEIKK